MSTGLDWILAIALALLTAGGVMLALRPLIGWLKRRAMWDMPNERSSHQDATPRGGGIAVTAGLIIAGAAWLAVKPDPSAALVLAGATALAMVSWLDDRSGGLPARFRLAVQAIAVGVVLAVLPAEARLAEAWLPLWLERLACFAAWLWFTNLFNFMDGINGITGQQMVTTGLGLAAVQLVAGLAGSGGGLALILAGAGLGFLPWNWGRAKVFLGDVGSVPAGYVLGWLLLDMALAGQWAAALILPMYYWFDATVTLLRRAFRGEKVWLAHRSHFYQQGARNLGGHVPVATRILLLNAAMVGLALVSVQGWPVSALALAAAVIMVVLLCRYFALPPKPVV